MSPEQIGLIRHPIDCRADLYSTGILFYRLLTGRLPFQGKNVVELVNQMATIAPQKPSRINPEIPEILDTVILRLIDKDPERRYQTATGLYHDLEKILSGQSPGRLSCDDPARRIIFHARHIGGEKPMESLYKVFFSASRGSGGVCLISGEAGSGKSRLASEFAAWATQKNALCLNAACLNRESHAPYQIFSDLLVHYLHHIELLPEAMRRESIRRIRSCAGDLTGLLCKLNPLLAEVFGPLPEVVSLDAEKDQKRFIAVCSEVVRSLGDDVRPAVLLLDDLHWADQGSLDILFDIWLHIAGVPLLIVGCFREKEVGIEHPFFHCREKARSALLPLCELPLAAFSQSETEELVRALFRTDAAWIGELAAFVLRKSAGNPFYSLEIMRQLAGKEVVCWRGGRWDFDRKLLGKVDVPEAMADVIMARIASVEGRLADILSVAAFIGKRFGVDFLLSLPDIGGSEETVLLLDDAVRLEFTEWDPDCAGVLIFLHERIREAFAAKLPSETKMKLHGLIGAALEKGLATSESETLFSLVHHFALSNDRKRCLQYAIEAAAKARESHAVTVAIRYFELSIGLLEECGLTGGEQWKTAAEGLIDLYPAAGCVEKANSLAAQLLAFAATPLEKARLHRIMGINFTRISSYDRAFHHFASGLSFFGRKIPRSKFATLAAIGLQLIIYPFAALLWPLRGTGKRREASTRDREIALFYQSLCMLFVVSDYVKFFWGTLRLLNFTRRRIGASKELANAISWYAMVFMAIPWISRCLHHHDRALAIKQSIGDRAGVAESHNWLGFAHSIEAGWEEALRHLTLAREICQSIGDYFQLVHVLNGLQSVLYLHTDGEKRLQVLRYLLSVSETIGSRYGTGIALTGLGGHYMMVGDLEASRTYLDKAIEVSAQGQQWLVVCVGESNRARLALEEGDIETALRHSSIASDIEQKHSLLRQVVTFRYIVMVEVLVARFLTRRDAMSDAERRRELKLLRKEVRSMLRAAKRWPMWRGDAGRLLAHYYGCRGKTRKSEAYFQAAIRALGKTGKTLELARCYQEYGLFLKDRGRAADASPLLRSALDLFLQIGASRRAESTAALLGTSLRKTDDTRLADTGRLASLLEISRSISSFTDLDPLLKEILVKAAEATGANRGGLFFINDANGYDLRVSHNWPANDPASAPFSRNIVERVRDTGRTVLTVNAAHQESFQQFDSVSANDMKSILCAPIMRRGAVLGVCYLDNPIESGVFDAGDREMLEALMAHAAICIENARAFGEIRERSRKLADDGERMKKRNAELEGLVEFQASHLRSFGGVHLVTQDSVMCGLIDQARRFADSQAPVLITGDSGSGKEIFAHLIHFSGRRKDGPFVKVNCSAIPETLFESEFFGYEKGAFTGAASSRRGKFELADGGTLMLDEIADLPPPQQAKLLRVLEEREITPVGGTQPRRVDVRVVAATNKDVSRLVNENKFRQDLFFRLGVLTLVVPPLSRRPGDIPVLAAYFLSSVANAEGGREKRFDDAALLTLRKMTFQGNVRQLKSLVHRLYINVDKEIIGADDVGKCLSEGNRPEARETSLGFLEPESVVSRSFLESTMPYNQVKEQFERHYLSGQLRKHDGNLTRTAQALGLLPSALSRKLKDLGVSVVKSGK
jgi:transcriptional regulator with GAF, ATPase, and Fis domain